MEIKTLQVFYGKDGLPYKDKKRQVHFPIAGTGFLGASNTTKIKFYYDELDNLDETTWVAVSKLPNGRVGSRVLESYLDDELNEHYALLELDNYYTQYKGDVFISLQGYQGGVNVDYDEENSQYEIHGTPTIAATGSIKFTINYANQFVGSGETDNINFQRILASLGTKLGMRAYSEHVEELPSEGSTDVFYVINDDPNDENLQNIYVWNEKTQNYVWVGDNTLDLGEYYTKEEGRQFENNVNIRVTEVENELGSVASGSPAGVYATLSDLATAYPEGDNNIYVVLATGKWYYWDGSYWNAGGDYLSSLPDTELSKTSTNTVQNRVITNFLFDNFITIEDGTIQDGNLSDAQTLGTSTGLAVPFAKSSIGLGLKKIEFAITCHHYPFDLKVQIMNTSMVVIKSVDVTIEQEGTQSVDFSLLPSDLEEETFYVAFMSATQASNNGIRLYSCTGEQNYAVNGYKAKYKVWYLDWAEDVWQGGWVKLTYEASYKNFAIEELKKKLDNLSGLNIAPSMEDNTGLTGSGAEFTLSNKVATVEATYQGGGIVIGTVEPRVVDHYYLYGIKVRRTQASGGNYKVSTNPGEVYPLVDEQQLTVVSGQDWHTYWLVGKFKATTWLPFQVIDESYSYGTPFEIKEPVIIDMTDIFGDLAPFINAQYLGGLIEKSQNGDYVSSGESLTLLDTKSLLRNGRVNPVGFKKLVCAGDSWTEASQNRNIDYGFKIASNLNMKYVKDGISGSRLSNGGSVRSFVGTDTERTNGTARFQTLPDSLDFLVIFFGINDSNANVTIGNVDSETATEFNGAWNIVLPYLINKYPTAKIGLVVPQNIQIAYAQAIRTQAQRYGLPIFDLDAENSPNTGLKRNVLSSINTIIANELLVDYHPNDKCYDMLAQAMGEWIACGMSTSQGKPLE